MEEEKSIDVEKIYFNIRRHKGDMTLYTRFVRNLMYDKMYIFSDVLNLSAHINKQKCEENKNWISAILSQIMAYQMKSIQENKRLIIWD